MQITEAGLVEDRGAVECNDVDTAHLLSQHDHERGESGATDARDREELDETGDIVAFANDVGFFQDLRVDVVEVAGRLKRGVSETTEGLERFIVATFLDVPARGLRAEVDADHQRYSWNKRRTELETPGDFTHIVHSQIGAESEEYTKRRPHLPTHDQSTTDRSRGIFGREDGHRGGFRPHPDAEEQTSDEKLLPGLGHGGSND